MRLIKTSSRWEVGSARQAEGTPGGCLLPLLASCLLKQGLSDQTYTVRRVPGFQVGAVCEGARHGSRATDSCSVDGTRGTAGKVEGKPQTPVWSRLGQGGGERAGGDAAVSRLRNGVGW